MDRNPLDPKGLIRESFRIEGITAAECRTIFLDWALSLEGVEAHKALTELHPLYAQKHPHHPMVAILAEGLHQMSSPRRRGGWKSRIRN